LQLVTEILSRFPVPTNYQNEIFPAAKLLSTVELYLRRTQQYRRAIIFAINFTEVLPSFCDILVSSDLLNVFISDTESSPKDFVDLSILLSIKSPMPSSVAGTLLETVFALSANFVHFSLTFFIKSMHKIKVTPSLHLQIHTSGFLPTILETASYRKRSLRIHSFDLLSDYALSRFFMPLSSSLRAASL
jgi:hypothetical protein